MKNRNFCLIPILLVLIAKFLSPVVNFLDILVVFISLAMFFCLQESHVQHIEIPQKKRIENSEPMPWQPLITRKPSKHYENSIPEDLPSPIIYSKIHIDSTIHMGNIKIPKYTTQETFDFNFSIDSKRPSKDLSKILNSLALEQKESSQKIALDWENLMKSNISLSGSLKIEEKYGPKCETLFEEIYNYYKQLNIQSELIKIQPKIPGARTRIIIDPAAEEFQKLIVEKVGIYKERLEESRKNIIKDVKIELESITSQITSDLDDHAHLNNRINAVLSILNKLDSENLNSAFYILCEAVVQRGQNQADSIDVGPNFALNFTRYIMKIANSYSAIHEIYFLAVVRIKHTFFPMMNPQEVQTIASRSELKDFAVDRLTETDKERFTMQMDRARAFSFLLGSLFASKESKFNEGDIWRWLSFVLNLPIEHIDRSHLAILAGFLKTTAGRLRESYGAQFTKLVKFLSGDYIQHLTNKFGKNPYLKAYITQLSEVIKHLV